MQPEAQQPKKVEKPAEEERANKILVAKGQKEAKIMLGPLGM